MVSLRIFTFSACPEFSFIENVKNLLSFRTNLLKFRSFKVARISKC